MTDSPADTATSTAQSETGRQTETEEQADGPRGTRPPRYAPPPQDRFDWRGWLLVGIVVLSFLVVPAMVLYLPHARSLIGDLGLSLRSAYLALPMVPALLLGVTAVWAAVRSRKTE